MKLLIRVTGVLLGFSVLTSAIAEDKRELVKFPGMMRNHMLQNMRDHLLALQEIQAFMAVSEYEKAADVAEAVVEEATSIISSLIPEETPSIEEAEAESLDIDDILSTGSDDEK